MLSDGRLPLISFTGSSRVGRRVASAVGARLGRALLELGGNNGVIVRNDANLELAVRAILFGAVGTAGQRCTSTRRVFLERGIAGRMTEALVAAYLIGEKGTAWHAVVLGVVTTLTHTSSVLLIALVLPLMFPGAPPKSVQAAIGLVGGGLIAATGLWLLMQRLAGRADHTHYEAEEGAPKWRQLIALGISGGIVPCWDAIALLGIAIASHQMWLALPLLFVLFDLLAEWVPDAATRTAILVDNPATLYGFAKSA